MIRAGDSASCLGLSEHTGKISSGLTLICDVSTTLPSGDFVAALRVIAGFTVSK